MKNNNHQRKNILLADFFSLATILSLLAFWLVFLFLVKNPSIEILLTLGVFSLPLITSAYVLHNRHTKLQEEIFQRELTTQELNYQRDRFSQAIEASRLALWEWDLTTDSMYHSNFSEIFGYKEEEIPHFMGNLSPLVHPDDFPKLRGKLVDTLKGRSDHFQCRFRIKHKSGEWRWIEDHGEVVDRNLHNTQAKKMLGTRRDVTDEQEKDMRLQLAWKIFEASGEATYIVNSDSQVIFVNQAFTEITGYSNDEIVNQNFWSLPFVQSTRDFYQNITERLNQQDRWEGELVQNRANGESYPQWLRVIRVNNSLENKPYTIGIFADLTQTQEAEERLNYLVEHDDLTSLANRVQFYEKLNRQLVKAKAFNQEISVLVFDIDRFKTYNNSLGHKSGDILLQKVANRIYKKLNEKVNLIARMGGNEFAIIYNDSLEGAVNLADELQSLMRKSFKVAGQDIRPTLSIGISCYPNQAKESQQLVNQADQARMSCKSSGGNKIQLYDDSIRQSGIELMRLEQDLRLAIEKNDIEVYYQPKLTLKDKGIYSAEALARWTHPEQGFVSPGVFIPLAEDTGLIEQLGYAVLKKSCQQIADWLSKGIKMQVAVNIAAQQLTSGDLLRQIDELLDEYEIPARLLQLELTESSLMNDADAAINVMHDLRNRGISLAIDDFGTGYSSLSYLQRFPLDILKIDRSFLVNDQNESSAANGNGAGTLTRAIIGLGHGLNLKVVAEGVEEEEQLNILTDLGCDYAQGFYISRPVPAPEFEQVLANYKTH